MVPSTAWHRTGTSRRGMMVMCAGVSYDFSGGHGVVLFSPPAGRPGARNGRNGGFVH